MQSHSRECGLYSVNVGAYRNLGLAPVSRVCRAAAATAAAAAFTPHLGVSSTFDDEKGRGTEIFNAIF